MDRKSPPRLLITDDHRLMAEAYAKMLQAEVEVVGIVTDGRWRRAVLKLKPDAVIVDVSMPRLNGLDAAEQARRKLPFAKFVSLTMNADPDLTAEEFRRGASGYVVKHSCADEFLNAIRMVMSGESPLSPLIARETMTYLLRRPKNPHKTDITRQRETLHLLAEGSAMKGVANILDITPRTVAFHKYSMKEKLGITSNAGLPLYALKCHVVPAQESA